MNKRRNQRPFTGPAKKPSSTFQPQLVYNENKIQKILADFQAQVNKVLQDVDKKIKRIDIDLNNFADQIDALIHSKKVASPTGARFFEFCQQRMNVPFTEMDMDVKFNTLLQFLENNLSYNDQTHMQYVFQAFDRRNNLQSVPPNIPIENGHIAVITWLITYNGQPLVGQQTPSMYTIGSKDLLVDDELIKMNKGEKKVFEREFPVDHHIEILKGKTVTVNIALYDFKFGQNNRTVADLVKLPQEEKKKIWQEKYKHTEIE